MTATLILYKDTKLTPERNFIIDDIADYLANLTKSTINDFQFQRFDLEKDIKLDLSQLYQEFNSTYNYNYCSIKDDTGKVVYYFITKKTQVASSTMAFHLMMDTANTFKSGTDFNLTDRTRIIREHKDRFSSVEYIPTKITLTMVGSSGTTTIVKGDDYEVYDTDSGEFVGYIKALDDYTIGYYETVEGIKFECDDPETEEYFKDNENPDFYIDNLGYEDIYDIVIDNGYYKLIRKIDLKSEEISAPVYKEEENIIYENEGSLQNSWALYYRTDTNADNSPIRCYLMPDTNITIQYGGTGNKIIPSDIPNGEYLFFYSGYNGAFNFVDGNETYKVYSGIQAPFSNNQDFICVAIKNNSGTLELYQMVYRWTPLYHIISIQDTKSLTRVLATTTTGFEFDLNTDVIKARQMSSIAQTYDDRDSNRPFRKNGWNVSFNLTTQVSYMNSIDSIDRTLPENIKIIDIPYSPSTIQIDSSKNYIFEGIWQFDALKKWFLLNNLTTRFENNIVSNVDDVLEYFKTNTSTIDTTAVRYLKDSKLFHSDYFRPKFVYDSFSRTFPLEQIDYDKSIENKETTKFQFDFIMTRNIVSKFLFRFNYTYKHSMEDYPNIVAVARNNEEVIYNSQYLNYIRTGYNYDLKTKERNEVASGIGLGLSVASLIGSIALTASGYGSAIGIAGIAGSVAGIAGSAVGMAKSVAQAEDNIQRKLQESQRQAVSVLNADDSDLLYAYTTNKAKLCVYNVSEQMEQILDDLFYYFGYLCNETKIPSFNSRYWFNFIQAEIELKDTGSNLTQEVIDNLKQRFASGITILHHHTTWNFDLDKENWEVSLL